MKRLPRLAAKPVSSPWTTAHPIIDAMCRVRQRDSEDRLLEVLVWAREREELLNRLPHLAARPVSRRAASADTGKAPLDPNFREDPLPYLTHVPFAYPVHDVDIAEDPTQRRPDGLLLDDLPATPGRLFKSAMPFRYDNGQLLAEARSLGVRVVVMLVSDKEARENAECDLRAEYASSSRALDCIHMPIKDYGVPPAVAMDAFEKSVADCVTALRAGRNVLVHCAAGIGRTGMFLACVLRRVEKLDGGDAILRIRSLPGMAGAVETQAQEDLVHLFPADAS